MLKSSGGPTACGSASALFSLRFFMNVDFVSFFIGFVFCMFSDVIFSVSSFFIQKVLDFKHNRKEF